MNEEKLKTVFRGKNVASSLRKNKLIVMRSTAKDKADMQATASSLDLSLTEYLNRLHFLAKENLETGHE